MIDEARSDRAQLPVNWGDTDTQRAMNGFERSLRSSGRSLSDEPALSLPRWGFGRTMERQTGEERSRGLLAEEPAADFAWPECARGRRPQVFPLTGDTADWYSDDYDFGCITLNITGDRTFDPTLRADAQAQLASDCELSGGRSRSLAPAEADHPESDTRASFAINVRISGVPYTITGECLAGAESFCLDRAAQCQLIERLVFKGGQQ